MRVAIAHWTRRVTGGSEEYIARIVPLLRAAGHKIALWHETEKPSGGALLELGADVSSWSAEDLGDRESLSRLRAWRPDVIYCNGVFAPHWHGEFRNIAPSALSIHSYGTCISGAKAHYSARPCKRKFGPPCLALYFPLRCGGLNPLTMLRNYQSQSQGLHAIRPYAALIVHSDYMRAEYARHEIDTHRVYLPVAPPTARASATRDSKAKTKFLYVGRMTKAKGGSLLFPALSIAQKQLNLPIEMTLAGDGDERNIWERTARRTAPDVKAQFVGWVDAPRRSGLFAESDLLVLPSTWPEPFGMVGLEAAEYGVPAAAFDVGGIGEWLRDGRNGALAAGDPPTASGLADAIVRCVVDPSTHAALRVGARQAYDEFAQKDFVGELTQIFDRCRNPRP